MRFTTKTITRIAAIALAVMVGTSFSAATPEEVSAAVKKPAKVTKLKVTEKTAGSVKLKWKKQKKVSGAKVKYIVKYRAASEKKWQTKKTGKNTVAVKNLNAGKKYKIKVQAYIKKGGKTYKGKFSKTVSAKTKSATVTVGGQTISVADGATVTIPGPDGGAGHVVEDAVVTVDDSGTEQSVTVEGTTSEGLAYRYFVGDNKTTHLYVGEAYATSWQGKYAGQSYKVEPKNGAVAYWTCDGTRPQVGQKDLTGKCRYTRDTYGYYSRKFSGAQLNPIDGYITTQLRGTTKSGAKSIIFDENKSIEDENIFWIRTYKNGKLVGEEFMQRDRDGYEYNPTQYKQEVIEYIEELNRYDEEHWGPETIR